MIEKPTCFVIGAGASMPYGCPSGDELVKRLYTYKSIDKSMLLGAGHHLDLLVQFQQQLREANPTSIDDFLAKHERFGAIGRTAIASVLLPLERAIARYVEPRPENRDDHWLAHVWKAMISGTETIEDFKNNEVSFVIFNYDRIVERFLQRSLSAYFAESDDICKSALVDMDLVHVYGSLGQYMTFGEGEEVDFGADSLDSIQLAADSIKIIPDARVEDSEFQTARRYLGETERVIFLGFGYDPTNLQRLQIREWAQAPHRQADKYRLFGTAVGMMPPQRAKTKQLVFGDLHLGREQADKSREFLERYIELETGVHDVFRTDLT